MTTKLLSPDDRLYFQAIDVVLMFNLASAALLQRHLGIEYTRAHLLLERMESNGVVSAMKSNGTRTISEGIHWKLFDYRVNEDTLYSYIINNLTEYNETYDFFINSGANFSPLVLVELMRILVSVDRYEPAHALSDFSLEFYPDNENILAITSLLAVVREDWPQAVDLLKQLIEMQGTNATAFTHSMLIRSLRCNLDLAEAFEACGIALSIYPEHPELLKEYGALADALGHGPFFNRPGFWGGSYF